jgi:hypothetical protein
VSLDYITKGGVRDADGTLVIRSYLGFKLDGTATALDRIFLFIGILNGSSICDLPRLV